MKKSVFLALAIGLAAPLAQAEMKKPAAPATPSAPAAPDTKKPAVPKESDESRLAKAKEQAATLSPDQATKLLQLLNTGDEKALREINQIGKARSAAIIAKRPYTKVEEVISKVPNVDSAAFADIITFGKGQQAAAPAKTPAPKPDMKKAQ